ncbi:type II secretion system protein [Deinococcus cellulosilyticus]|uniref:Prepilin-type N-terminal cleavage/methylation domain-containing protein n=1 Tax=Deinococcus cellulosilyticus (strain DSM 18568 / NBRC 106333 / KACC 11606 / 5516J-15) TaxID=1223518 RepID=A0A511N9V4_DEIC1|nr:hypothetical protein [Deinococcus cellulosilyticus]GEM49605.1 hypothetical protein DC3_52400 [Deinococcus cellulosilyticus NBRC 106333 = KACC 11606]
MKPMKPAALKPATLGFTVVEVLCALMLLMVLITATTNMALGSYKSDQEVQKRNQITQIMMGLGRRLVSGDTQVIPATGTTSRSFSSAQLGSLGFANTTDVTATVTSQSTINYSGSAFSQYQLQVCWKTTCVKSSVAAPGGI